MQLFVEILPRDQPMVNSLDQEQACTLLAAQFYWLFWCSEPTKSEVYSQIYVTQTGLKIILLGHSKNVEASCWILQK